MWKNALKCHASKMFKMILKLIIFQCHGIMTYFLIYCTYNFHIKLCSVYKNNLIIFILERFMLWLLGVNLKGKNAIYTLIKCIIFLGLPENYYLNKYTSLVIASFFRCLKWRLWVNYFSKEVFGRNVARKRKVMTWP